MGECVKFRVRVREERDTMWELRVREWAGQV